MGEENPLFKQVAVLVKSGDLATGPKTGINRQNPSAAQRRLHQETVQISSEHFDRMGLGFFGQFPANFSFEAGYDQTIDGIFGHSLKKLRMRMIRQRELTPRRLVDGWDIPFQLDLDWAFFFPAVEGEDAMRGNVTGRLGELEIVLIIESLSVRKVVAFSSRQFAGLPKNAPHRVASLGGVGDLLGQDVLRAR